jgi:hypothetical protein
MRINLENTLYASSILVTINWIANKHGVHIMKEVPLKVGVMRILVNMPPCTPMRVGLRPGRNIDTLETAENFLLLVQPLRMLQEMKASVS